MPLWLTMRGADPFPLVPGVDVTIGRGRKCELSVYSSLLSREHARIRWEHDRPVLFDLDSLNGCYVGVDKVLRHHLQAGDTIRLGDLLIWVIDSALPPGEPAEGASDEAPVPDRRPELTPTANETQIFSRTTALHQQVFAYDELTWLGERIQRFDLADGVRDPRLEGPDLVAWREAHGDAALWRLLSLGVVAPPGGQGEVHMDAAQVAGRSRLTPRGEKLRGLLLGRRAHWNEMASLRYRVRQSAFYRPLRMLARAYRPGSGLDELDPGRIAYELEAIYASSLPKDAFERELRYLLCLGVFAAEDDAASDAWFPARWDEDILVLAPRGRALLEGFRLEEDE